MGTEPTIPDSITSLLDYLQSTSGGFWRLELWQDKLPGSTGFWVILVVSVSVWGSEKSYQDYTSQYYEVLPSDGLERSLYTLLLARYSAIQYEQNWYSNRP